ncbi:preprotein translocase subunit YajC [Clostridium ganghwense]|uniref:Preprotein translocase subunit YajC n=1 Tax=Clostridium ganghwense TaxID=312089 RepID=A0ABT4CN34_9CLOT|nr:preprotein translocase subunit YajC [Clostridium ganghwense]MCY6370464.1 preprotein translocase subunit YajC [Clostridium ganghwense]
MPQQGSIIALVLPFIFVMALFYIFISIPEKKRKKQYNAMIEGLRINDEVMTRGGIVGKITKIKDDFIIIESGPDKVKFKLKKNGIAAVTSVIEEKK